VKLFRLYKSQFLPITLDEAWQFFSKPNNLNEITPPEMSFDFLSPPSNSTYAGQLIQYKIRPVLNIPVTWVTEITQCTENEYFIDEQRFGPYSFWHHQHHFKAVDGGVEMIDELHWGLPFGFIGRLFAGKWVKKQIEHIFALIGTTDGTTSNLAIVSSVTHLGSNPALLGYIMRPTTVPRHTYDNIRSSGYYSINHVSASYTAQAHQTSAKYENGVSEFETCGLNEYYQEGFPAPFVAEAPIKIGMKFLEEHSIKTNGTIHIIGQVETIEIEEYSIAQDGFIDLSALSIVTVNGLDQYALPVKIERYKYARPYQKTEPF